jgi:2-dehydro-3-deoxyphosphogluconate aldolase / (4S)-4-hydroxy-2-oxoglutarate aldolase
MNGAATAALDAILRARVVPIIRTASPDWAAQVADVLAASGLEVIEVTFTVPDAATVVRGLRARFPNILIGAGTVTTGGLARTAVDAGAQFLLSPSLSPGMVEVAHRAGVLAVPGAFTPTEVVQALDGGAELIKIFPAESGGPRHIRALLAPLAHARLLPTGGITPQNVGDWFRAGAAAVGIGSALTGPGDRAPDLTALRAGAAALAKSLAAP